MWAEATPHQPSPGRLRAIQKAVRAGGHQRYNQTALGASECCPGAMSRQGGTGSHVASRCHSRHGRSTQSLFLESTVTQVTLGSASPNTASQATCPPPHPSPHLPRTHARGSSQGAPWAMSWLLVSAFLTGSYHPSSWASVSSVPQTKKQPPELLGTEDPVPAQGPVAQACSELLERRLG